jgi:hypothetical protein
MLFIASARYWIKFVHAAYVARLLRQTDSLLDYAAPEFFELRIASCLLGSLVVASPKRRCLLN